MRQQPRGLALLKHASVTLLACGLAAVPAAVRAEVVTIHELVGNAGNALGVMMAEAEHSAAAANYQRTKLEKGWKLGIGTGYGQERDLVDESRTRAFEAIRTEVRLAYPLLGSHAVQEREVEIAAGSLAEAQVRRDAALKIAELHIEDVYAALWGAQESLEVIDAYLKLEGRTQDDEEADFGQARSDRRRLERRREEARVRLEQLSGRGLPGMIASSVQLPKVPELDPKRLRVDHPDLAELRARQASTRAQLDGSVWYGIESSFDIVQSTVQDRSDGQAGNALYAYLNVTVPLTFYQAGISERRKLRSEMDFLELKMQDTSREIVEKARASEAEYMDAHDDVENATRRARRAGELLRQADGRPAPARLRDYYTRALEEIEARTAYWRAHVALRSFIPVGAAEPAPEPTGPTISDVGTRLAEPLLKVTSS